MESVTANDSVVPGCSDGGASNSDGVDRSVASVYGMGKDRCRTLPGCHSVVDD